MTNKISETLFGKCIQSFAVRTTCHGYKDLYFNNSCYGKIFWVLAIVAANLIAIQQIAQSVTSYINSGVSISTKDVSVSSQAMPDLMFCPGSGLDLDTMYRIGLPINLIDNIQRASKLFTHTDMSNDFNTSQSRILKELDEAMQHLKFSRYSEFYKYFSYKCEELLEVHTTATLIPIDDSCRLAKFQLLFDYLYCWKIPIPDQKFSGLAAGLAVMLRSLQSNYSSSESESNGFVLGILGKDVKVTTGTDTILVPVNTIVNIELYEVRKKTLQRREWPRNAERCRKMDTSQLPCEHECFSHIIQKTCGCSHAVFSNETSIIPECSPFDLCPLQVAKHSSELESCIQDCIPNCEKRTYKYSTSYMDLNSELIKKYSDLSLNRSVKGYTYVRMGFPELQFSLTEEQDSYTLTSLISNIGGQLGLWLGCSLLSLVQIIAILACQSSYHEN